MRSTALLLKVAAGASVVSMLALPAAALAGGYDVKPSVSAGKIVTDGYNDDTGVTKPGLRVFAIEFGETPSDPYNLDDPGFNSVGAAGFAPGSELRLEFLPLADGGYVSYWGGSGAVGFGSLPTTASPVVLTVGLSETVFATLGQSSLAFTGTTASIPVSVADANGAIPDDHLISSIGFASATQDPTTNPVPAGAYLVAARLLNPGGAISSDTIYFLFANGLSEEGVEAAEDYVASVVVPEPAAIGLLAPAAALVLRRRR